MTTDWHFTGSDGTREKALVAWQALNEAHCRNNPALDSRFIDLSLKYYGDGDEVIAIGKMNDRDVAAAVLKPLGPGQWTLFQPGQMCLSPFLHARDTDLADILKSLMASLPGFCCLLRLPKVDPLFQNIDGLARKLTVDIEEYGDTFSIELEGTFDDFWNSRGRSLKQNSRRWFRSVEKGGITMELQSLTGSDSMAKAVAIHAELESSGWKGAHGSAIGVTDRQGEFYRELLGTFAEQDNALTFQLLFDDRPVASLLAIVGGGTIVILKTAHSETHRDFSPGRLIDYLALQKCFTPQKYSNMEMYTRASRSDLSWATGTRKMHIVDAYRSRSAKLAVDGARLVRNAVTGIVSKPGSAASE